jgi:hypothetical protein
MKRIKKLFSDLLMEKGFYSQGRIYLFISVLAYYITLGILTCTGMSKKHADIDINNFKMIVDGLQYAMFLFAGYVFGGKFVDVLKEAKYLKSNDSANATASNQMQGSTPDPNLGAN